MNFIESTKVMCFVVLWMSCANVGLQSVFAKTLFRYQVVDNPAIQQKRVACGPNSLYMFLISHGKSCQYEEVRTSLPMLNEGCTLLALRNTAEHFGLSVRVLKYTAGDLKYMRFPAIVHFQKSVFFGDNINHYVLLTKFSGDQIEYIDGTSGRQEAIMMKKFDAVSDGYVLEAIGDAQVPWFAFMVPISVLIGGVFYLQHCSKVASRSTLVVIVLFTYVSSLAASETIARELQAPDIPTLRGEDCWRTPAQDAINILHLYFKTVNLAKPRETIARFSPKSLGASLAELAQVASDLGVPLQIVRPAISSVNDFSFPLIVHMFDDKEQNGGFFLLLSYNASSVQVVNAAVATIESYSADEFRRRWSGYALVREEAKTSVVRTGGITLLGLAGYFLFRFGAVESDR